MQVVFETKLEYRWNADVPLLQVDEAPPVAGAFRLARLAARGDALGWRALCGRAHWPSARHST